MGIVFAQSVFLLLLKLLYYSFQEHKIPKSQLTTKQEPLHCAHVVGYESFWSCCTSTTSKGMNGVVTYVKQGYVQKADAFIFRDASLDDQGRCVVTDHGSFVVFNVYVPAGGHGMTAKMKYLRQLQAKMQEQREKYGKKVLLVGDLNISHGKLDVYWKNLQIHVQDILEEVEHYQQHQQAENYNSTSNEALPNWKTQLASAWPLVLKTLQTKHTVPTTTKNTFTGTTYDRYRLCVKLESPVERSIFLGRHETTESACYYDYSVEEETHYLDPETNQAALHSEAGVVSLEVLQELMLKIARIEWTDTQLREIANSTSAGRSRIHPPRQWLSQLLSAPSQCDNDNTHRDNNGNQMVDVFRYLYPTAQGRFTIWHQFQNTRYHNGGTRIDYTLVDRCLLPYVLRGSCLRTGKTLQAGNNIAAIAQSNSDDRNNENKNDNNNEGNMNESNNSNNDNNNRTIDEDPLTEEAALAAATARGKFQPVSFEGGGIVEASQEALDTQFGPRHTGMIYTPPSYSDHIAISLLLADSTGKADEMTGESIAAVTCKKTFENEVKKSSCVCTWLDENWGKLVLDGDPSTKRSQPHKVQTSIASFFSNNIASSGGSNSSNTGISAKTRLPPKRPAATMKSFFQPKSITPSTTFSDTFVEGDPSQNIAPGSTASEKVSKNNKGAAITMQSGKKKKISKSGSTTSSDSILNHFVKK